MKRKDIELMAPAGSYESLMAAIQGGADAIYFGVEQLNMRAASSNNFTIDDLRKIASICREKGLKSYITLNVVIFDHETGQMRRIIDAAAESGISAVIASDLSVIKYAFSKGMEVHLSTQLNITNSDALEFYSRWADVVVLARELNLSQVKHISECIVNQNIRGPRGELVKIEMFVHGALCMAVSGKCYLSLHENNKSANRGECYQTCRKSYIATGKESGYQLEIDNEYIMSPKDLCTIGFLDRLIDAGVSVLKIEGRARSAEYVKEVSSCYSEAISAIAEGTFTIEKTAIWRERLAGVFNRGFWDGYYLGQRLGEWSEVYGSAATKRKILIGTGTNYYSRLGVGEFDIQSENLMVGDEVIITGPTTGLIEITIEEIHNNGGPIATAIKGERIAFHTGRKIRRGDKLFKWVKTDLPANAKSIIDPDDPGS